MNTPLCSVIIPCYNSDAFLMKTIASVQAQTYKDIEIIVVDDGSTDSTPIMLAEACRQDGRLVYLRQDQNQGVAAARNRGVETARSQWVAFLDSDDMWLPDKLEKQFRLQKETGAELLYTASFPITHAGEKTGKVFAAPPQTDYETLCGGNVIITSSVLVKREHILRHPFVKNQGHEDFQCWLHLLKDGVQATGVTEPLIRYRLTHGSLSRNKLKSALMTYRSLKLMQIPFPKRCLCFVRYIRHGLRRYL